MGKYTHADLIMGLDGKGNFLNGGVHAGSLDVGGVAQAVYGTWYSADITALNTRTIGTHEVLSYTVQYRPTLKIN